jgi:uncharacterized protein YdaU (DUF1376 family)
MNKAPAYQMYAEDLLVDTLSWTNEELGVHVRLFNYQWANGALPAEFDRMAKIAGISVSKLRKLWVVIGEKYVLCDDGKIRNRRMADIQQVSADYRAKQAELGKAGAAKRWGAPSNGNGVPHTAPHTQPHALPHRENDGERIALQSSSSSLNQNQKQGDSAGAPSLPPQVEQVKVKISGRKPKLEGESDPRFKLLREEIIRLRRHHAPEIAEDLLWEYGKEDGQLATWLKSKAKLTADLAVKLWQNWAASDVNHAESVGEVAKKIHLYATGPLDKWGKPVGSRPAPAEKREARPAVEYHQWVADWRRERPVSGTDEAQWQAARRLLATRIDPHSFGTWVKPVFCGGVRNGTFYLLAPAREYKPALEKFRKEIEAALAANGAAAVAQFVSPEDAAI